ncbi:Ig-like domain-containing protein [Corallococcus sp. BB11-1]|uniref:Ig-like domain-containing protein n=1 Tax=Corallococcus sp. BB11-1 TaxID=2996783 RepID=UPI00226EC8ED|nr:Ig-like domain-containing protein [Corallococcus sp. BB11-1]MCY1036854.1 Ig-like domain-containing protein [Corallococcus sp. BB11-1]
MRLRSAALLFATCAALALPGCDDDEPPLITPDAGTSADAGTDAGIGTDAGADPDAGTLPTSSATVTTSDPAEGATDVYPLEMYLDASGEKPVIAFRKVLSLTFSEPMDPTLAQVTLRDRTDATAPARVLTGSWSPDARTLTVTVPRPQDVNRPLEAATRYTVELTALKDAAGHAWEPGTSGLGDGALDFTTGERDPALEHACAHTLVNVPEAVTAGRTPFDFPPDTHTGHALYDVTLRSGEAGFGGYTSFISDPENTEHVTLYLNQEVATKVTNDTAGGADVPSVLAPTRFVCGAITHTLSFTAEPGDQFYLLQFGPVPAEKIQFVLERE